ncbi:methyltransferase domain-containing protein [Sphingobacteriales bacterium UPWRP_1]|nr:arsenite S-adenosylmethyltransferase [Sphingobacteriales bacterium TSM_CSS]PSJ77394.1 methyltransferase domain-containing protein [Sphingobacteriales bacterium UPWRP_1]
MQNLKDLVKEKYGQIANQSAGKNKSSCCGSCSCNDTTVDYTIMADDYQHLAGYNSEADLGLGCGLPTEFAQIKPGNTVVDLGSGAGNDCFVARAETGETGRVIGLDFTPAMLEKARKNAAKLGYNNVEFVLGDIENMPLPDNLADVVVSNCVFNLIPDKRRAFAETYRILKPGGHMSISDIVLDGELPADLQKAAEMYAGCVSGALQKEAYLSIIREAGFKNCVVQKQKSITIPSEILLQYLTPQQIALFNQTIGIYSITVFAQK